MAITASGLGSGLDIKGLVEQLVSAERTPAATQLATREARATAQLTAIGRLKSALSTFQGAVGELADITRFQKRTATVSDAERLAAAASAEASPGSYQIEVLALASAHRLLSGAFASADTVVGEGQLQISTGSGSMQIEITAANNTLAGIRDAINASQNNPGVRASIINGTGGAYLTLTSTSTGAAGAITVDAVAAGSALEVLEYGAGTTNALSEQSAASDASARIDGLTVSSTTNSIATAIDGVTIDLLEAGAGTLITLDVAYDEKSAKEAVAKFVSAYNGVAGLIAELTGYNAETKAAGTLLGDAATRSIKNALRTELGRAVGDSSEPFRTLAEIGVTTANNGFLSIDASRLDEAIDTDFDAVGRLFATEDSGIAVRLKSVIDDVLGNDGRLATRESTLRARIDDIGEQRTTLERRMEAVRQRYQNQFIALDKLVGQLNQTSNFLSQQLARL
jgi:flagellar hook-associated protein 2